MEFWLLVAALAVQSFEPLYREAVDRRVKELGPDHPRVAESLTNLGLFLRNQGRKAAAEPVLRRAVAIREKTGGLDLAASLENLASVVKVQEPLLRRALKLREQTLGPDHLDLTANLVKLAELTQDEALYKRAIAIYDRTPGHSQSGILANNLGLVLEGKGKMAEAESQYRRAVEVGEQALGASHPEVAAAMANLAGRLEARGDRAGAGQLYRQAAEAFEASLGPGHPDTIRLWVAAAAMLDDQAAARALYQRLLPVAERSLGPRAPMVLEIRKRLAAR